MRHEFYQFFYDTLKKFVKFDDFSIEFEFLKENIILTFSKTLKLFEVSKVAISLQKPEAVYLIIKNYVEKQIAKNQKEAFCGSLEEKANEIITLTDEEYETFCYLEEKFKPLLLEEPISPYDIEVRGCLHRLEFGFNDSKISSLFLYQILEVIQAYPSSFKNGRIEFWMWGNSQKEETKFVLKENILLLKKEGYLVISEEDLEKGMFTVAFTEKFYEAFKKSFYYDYDPRVVRPTGCILAS